MKKMFLTHFFPRVMGKTRFRRTHHCIHIEMIFLPQRYLFSSLFIRRSRERERKERIRAMSTNTSNIVVSRQTRMEWVSIAFIPFIKATKKGERARLTNHRPRHLFSSSTTNWTRSSSSSSRHKDEWMVHLLCRGLLSRGHASQFDSPFVRVEINENKT